MLELGKYSRTAHKKIAGIVAKKGIDVLFTVGELAKITAEQFKSTGGTSFAYKKNKNAMDGILKQIKSGDLILIKGSRAMKMEEIAGGIIRKLVVCNINL